MHSAHNKGKSVVAERFIRTLKSKIYEHMTLVSKNMYIDKLDDIVSKYNNIYHSTIEMKPVDVNSNTHIHSSKETNDENSKFKKHFLQKAMFQIGLKKFLLLQEVKILFCRHMLFVIVKMKKLLERFKKKELQKNKSKGV